MNRIFSRIGVILLETKCCKQSEATKHISSVSNNFQSKHLKNPIQMLNLEFKQISTSNLFCQEHRKSSISSGNASSQPHKQSATEIADESESKPLELTPELIHHLERTSLVDFDNTEGLRRLEQAIKFADQILEVDTTGVEPMSTVLEEM